MEEDGAADVRELVEDTETVRGGVDVADQLCVVGRTGEGGGAREDAHCRGCDEQPQHECESPDPCSVAPFGARSHSPHLHLPAWPARERSVTAPASQVACIPGFTVTIGEIPTLVPTLRRGRPEGAISPLVGRADEVVRLELALGELKEGRPRLLEIVGEPGIGKTRLLDELCLRADRAGLTTLRARAAQAEQSVPFAPFVTALDDHVAGAADRCREELSEAAVGELGAIFGSLGDLGAVSPHQAAPERFHAHRAVRALLELLARKEALVLALDDLHWADDASLELIAHLLRNPPRGPVLIAFARRPGVLEGRPRDALDAAVREGELWRLEPGPLAAEHARTLLGALGRSLAEAARREAGGNPFYLEQLAAHPAALMPTTATAGASESDLPASVGAALGAEIESLGGATRLALHGAAVAGDPFEPELAAQAAELDRSTLLDALEIALDHDLVQPDEDARRLGFRHPIVRRAIYADAPPGWRLDAHRRVAAALAARGASPLAQAHHVARSARVGDGAAVALLRAAAEAARVSAPASAAHWYGEALRLLGDRADDRLELLAPMATALAAAGDFAGAQAALEQGLRSWPTDPGGGRTRLVAECAACERLLGRHAEATARLGTELERVGDAGSADGVALLVGLTVDAFYTGDWPQARELAARAHAGAEALDDRAMLAATSALMAVTSQFTSPASESLAHLDAGLELADALPDAACAERAEAIQCLCMAAYFLGRFPESAAQADRFLRIAKATGQGSAINTPRFGRSMALVELGRIAEALEDAETALDAARLTDNPFATHNALLVVCHAATHAGELDLALAAAGEIETLAAGLEANTMTAGGAWIRAEALLECGLRERCEAPLRSSLAGPAPVAPFVRTRSLELLVACALERGDHAEAAELAGTIERQAHGRPLGEALGRRAWGAVLLARGDAPGAVAAAREAIAGLEEIGAALEAERSRILLGRALAAGGERQAAIRQLETARERLAEFGAHRDREGAERELRRLGARFGRPGAATRDGGVGALTAREREVAELVATGRTNKQVGAALFVSDKAVEKHLSSVYAKLGIPGRGALGAALADDR
ncbi:MAG: AAA family ATPase [Solirubrobacterales bacterium]|nr:AAA family ATPase [Solirubrobacterales bacterium]